MVSVSSAPHYALQSYREGKVRWGMCLAAASVTSCGESWDAKLYLPHPNLSKICFVLYFCSPQSQFELCEQELNEKLRLLKDSIYHRTLQVLFPWEALGLVCVFLVLHSYET